MYMCVYVRDVCVYVCACWLRTILLLMGNNISRQSDQLMELIISYGVGEDTRYSSSFHLPN